MLKDYVIRRHASLGEIDAAAWDALLAAQAHPTPFMRHAYLHGLEVTGCVGGRTGWVPEHLSLWRNGVLVAACPRYRKTNSRGEYVFDFAWADAYQRHGLAYYPKSVVAVPFTPVPGSRLLAHSDADRAALVQALVQTDDDAHRSSAHLLFGSMADVAACVQDNWLPRQTVQFHWQSTGEQSFDDLLDRLNQDKRKKIRQERRKVMEADVDFSWLRGQQIDTDAWDFFYRCYAQTYAEHGNPPYLTRAFFAHMAQHMPEAWALCLAHINGEAIACSLIAIDAASDDSAPTAAWGRYWGSLVHVDCLHFEACYYQPLQWCIAHDVQRFEGGAQGEHKMARALLPTVTRSAHRLVHPAFRDAVAHFLQREDEHIDAYLQHLKSRSPLKKPSVSGQSTP